MLNEHINEFSVDEGLTQVASYFNIVDNAVKTGDTNKRYTISSNASTAPSCPFNLGSWTSFVISPQGDNMCDLFNSYITVDINLKDFTAAPSTAAAAVTAGYREAGYWVGFKDSMDAVEQYQILANGQSIYTQSNAIEESYITNLASTEAVKRVDVYSKCTHKDAWNGKDTCMTGTVINASNYNNAAAHVIRLKIDLRRFLPLAAIKYLPEFAGNIELRIKFGISGLVCTPLSHEYVYGKKLFGASNLTDYNNKFVPFAVLGEGSNAGTNQVKGVTSISESSGSITVTVGNQTAIKLAKVPSIENCFSHLACFGLDDNLYQQLIQRYMKESLSFPIQTLTFNQMNGSMAGTTGRADFALTATPRFVDTIFVLFPFNNTYKTCYENPLFKVVSLKMGGYGSVPEIPISTTGPEFYELVSNAFNTNNDLTGFNKDVMKSLTNTSKCKEGFESNDVTNFVLAFPTSTDNTFQQGQTSNTPITYQLKTEFDNTSPYYNDPDCTPIMGFLKDSVLAIQLRPSGPPIISLDEYDITSPAE